MLPRDKMSTDEYQHLRRTRKRYYRQADRLAKKALLDEMGGLYRDVPPYVDHPLLGWLPGTPATPSGARRGIWP